MQTLSQLCLSSLLSYSYITSISDLYFKTHCFVSVAQTEWIFFHLHANSPRAKERREIESRNVGILTGRKWHGWNSACTLFHLVWLFNPWQLSSPQLQIFHKQRATNERFNRPAKGCLSNLSMGSIPDEALTQYMK